MASETRWTTGNHPAPEQLLLAHEGELPREDAEPILAHIHQCWECRARVEGFTRGIAAYVEFRKLHMDPPVTPAPGGWLRLAARMRGAPSRPETQPDRTWKRVPKNIWLALPAMAATAFLVVLMISPARLTATVVFDRAMRAEAEQGHPALERVSVRRGGKLLAVDDGVLRAAYIERSRPLSVNPYRKWHDALHEKKDSVTSDGNEIRVETTTGEGTIALARLTVARQDFAPRTKHVELRDGVTIDVETVEGASAPAEARSDTATPASPEPAPAADSGLDKEEREALEMEVRWALRRIDADLGEPLAIDGTGSELVLRGTLDDQARREQIVAALARLPHVATRLELATPDAADLANARPVDSSSSETSGPLLGPQFRKDLPDPEARAALVSAALDASHQMLSHTWALRRLAQRYSVMAESALPAGVRASLTRLVAAHEEAIASAAGKAASLWKPYAQLDGRSALSRTDWQEASRRALRSAQAFDHLTARLLAASGNDGLSAEEALRRLRETYRQLLSTLGVTRENQ
jgi:hypothetical protein